MSTTPVTYTVVNAWEGRALILRDEGDGHAGHFECPTEFLASPPVVGDAMPILIDPRITLQTQVSEHHIVVEGSADKLGSELFRQVCLPILQQTATEMTAANPKDAARDIPFLWAGFMSEAMVAMTSGIAAQSVVNLLEGLLRIARTQAGGKTH